MSFSPKKAFSLIELSIVILIIGIILAGVTQSSRLVGEFRLQTARKLTQSSPIAAIKNLAFWVESTSQYSFATGTSSFTNVKDMADGVAIGRWNDLNPQKALKSINPLQATSGSQPLFKTGIINSLPAVLYDGTDDCLSVASLLSTEIADVGGQQITIFLVQKLTTSSNGTYSPLAWGDDITNRITLLATHSNAMYMDVGSYLTGRITQSAPASFYNNPKLITYRRSSADGQLWIDGTSLVSSSSLSGFIDVSTEDFSVGNCATGSFFPGYIAEVIIFDRALKTEEIDDVEEYIASKWNLSVS